MRWRVANSWPNSKSSCGRVRTWPMSPGWKWRRPLLQACRGFRYAHERDEQGGIIMTKFPMITTIQQHVLQQQEELFPEARGIFSALISGISLATKAIQAQVRRAGLGDQLGLVGETNVQGEEQQKLDVYANQMLLHCLG